MNQILFQGPVKGIVICHIWEFLKGCRVELADEVRMEYAQIQRDAMAQQSKRFAFTGDSGMVYAKTEQLLKMNPASVLVDLKKTTTRVERRGKKVFLEPLLHDLAAKSMMNMGELSHMFPIGQNRYALVDHNDIRLAVTKDYRQTLICVYPSRNFQVYAPNLKVIGL